MSAPTAEFLIWAPCLSPWRDKRDKMTRGDAIEAIKSKIDLELINSGRVYVGKISKENSVYGIFKFEGTELRRNENIMVWVKPEELFFHKSAV